MSNDDRLDLAALAELERVLAHLSDELATWRRRALTAEAQQAELGIDHDIVAARERVVELEDENAEYARRLDGARTRVAELLARLRFLEEQVALEEPTR